ncbi:hypothetical protein MCOR27_000983 [Pyricularia oryzae]|uniref:Carboxylic ester hydrolase n=1 Tax=Pyricularia grisea TaxID=148305 RepID=A0ABQ8P118_PYRGI|nr:hypothetical protein MCOR19_005414 [Pyricularia oryzae]KAI6304449.1 hypothetical protein MCOR33_000543 [Pyricularia grisea]KAI6281941.1 hypothetical protein MCOR26_003068 [Pyricularia oryzae]KAI6288311.1 hypothetical protein MCOR27_000983 [Pyricularia oryzae]KAI6320265.1 hypothetical protein MCOR30_008320 [Pyricularia oryzae]
MVAAANLVILMVAQWLAPTLAFADLLVQPLQSAVSIVVHNDLNGFNESAAQSSVIIVHTKYSIKSAQSACAELNATLWPGAKREISASQSSIRALLRQQEEPEASGYWIRADGDRTLALNPQGNVVSADGSSLLPVLCTRSAPIPTAKKQDTLRTWLVGVDANNETTVGYQDAITFNFLGVRYAPQPERLAYSTRYIGSGGLRPALTLGSKCIQDGEGSEDCLFLNIWTSFLPGSRSNTTVEPKAVMFYIHGSALTGSGGDPTFDGTNLASRGDVVVVTVNYRLGALGFLALADTDARGNYALGDLITALDWVRDNIAPFGGDPSRITVLGQSAGAALVRAMMASPRAAGKFAGAVLLSYLGGYGAGGVFQKYYTLEEQMALVTDQVLNATDCSTAPSQLACLRALPANDIWKANPNARLLTIDGEYLADDERALFAPGKPRYSRGVHVMLGVAAEDGLELIAPYPPLPRNLTARDRDLITARGLPAPPEALFPLGAASSNVTLEVYRMWARLATDAFFRCAAQANAHAAVETGAVGKGGRVWYYQFDRTYQVPSWPRLDLCEAPGGDVGSPEGNFRCHTGEMLYVFGSVARAGLPYRDEGDLVFERYVLDSFASFARTYDPNPDVAFLEARGYASTLEVVNASGRWEPTVKGNMRMRTLDLPGRGDAMKGFQDLEQCEWLGVPTDYWLR